MSTTGTWKTSTLSFDEALARLPEALKAEGFGIISQIDLKETFAAKLGVTFGRYKIFGACNPSFAHAAVESDPHIGVLLPCNVVLYEQADGRAVVGAVDPMQTLAAAASDEKLRGIAAQVGQRLERALAAVAG